MKERLSKKAVSNYEPSAWVVFLGLAGGYTCGSFGYWIDTKFNNWLEAFAEED